MDEFGAMDLKTFISRCLILIIILYAMSTLSTFFNPLIANAQSSPESPPPVIWQQNFGGALDEDGRSVRQTLDGGYIIVGSINPYPAPKGDVYLVKTFANGTKEWEKSFDAGGTDYGYAVEQISDGGYIIAGQTWSYGWGDVCLIKTFDLSTHFFTDC
jgi:hypothetical protein